MQDGSSFLLATETEASMGEWMKAIKTVISPDNVSQKSAKTDGRVAQLLHPTLALIIGRIPELHMSVAFGFQTLCSISLTGSEFLMN